MVAGPLWLVSIWAALSPSTAVLAVAGLVGLGAALPAAFGLVPGTAFRLLEAPLAGLRLGDLLVTAFLLGWIARVVVRREPVLEGGDTLGRPIAVLAAVTVTSLMASAADTKIWADPQDAFRSSVFDLVTQGLVTDAGYVLWARPAAAGILQGLLLVLSVRQLARSRPALCAQIVRLIVIAASAVGVLACLQLLMDLARLMGGFGDTLLRTSVHLTDMNAAGSQFLAAALIATGLALSASGRSRRMWFAALVPIVVGLWLSGSRTAMLVGMGTVFVVSLTLKVRRPVWRRLAIGSVLVVALVGLTPLSLLPGMPSNAASRSALHRLRFLQTSVSMWQTAPVFGVGIGQYWLKSGDFMPAELRQTYANENAHNNFAQFGAEMGVIGLAAIIWLLGAAGVRISRGLRVHHGGYVLAGLAAGLSAFVTTCLTSHPLLVQPVASVFWIALGTAIAWADTLHRSVVPATEDSLADQDGQGIPPREAWRRAVRRTLVPALVLLLAVSVPARVAVARQHTDLSQVKYGFIRLFASAEATPEYLAGPEATFFVRNETPSVELSFGGSESGEPVDVDVLLNNVLVSRVRVHERRWSSHRILMPRNNGNAGFARVDLKVASLTRRPVSMPRAQPGVLQAGPRVRMVSTATFNLDAR